MSEPRDQLPIVVGIDGSEDSKNALRWAARQAELTATTLEAVTAWQLPVTFGTVWQMPITYGKSHDLSQVDFTAEAKEDTGRGAPGRAGPEPTRVGDAPARQRASDAGAHRGLATRRSPRSGP
jgi:universal stress protein family protein